MSIDKCRTNKVGFPRIEMRYDMNTIMNQNLLRSEIMKDFIDMDDPSINGEIKDSTEYIIHTSDKNEHKLEISVKSNRTTASKQKAVRDKIIADEKLEGTYKNRIDKNVLIIYIDNISRAHFMRKMPKTARWLEDYVDNDESDYSTYQFFRYHSEFYSTGFSNAGMFFGANQLVYDVKANMFDSFSQNGYVTGFTTDTCKYADAQIAQNFGDMHRFDHFGGTIACDPNFDVVEDGSIHWFSGAQSVTKR